MHKRILFQYFGEFEVKIWSWSDDRGTEEQNTTDTKILPKNLAEVEGKFWSGFCNRRRQEKWIIVRRILFKYFVEFKSKISGWLDDEQRTISVLIKQRSHWNMLFTWSQALASAT